MATVHMHPIRSQTVMLVLFACGFASCTDNSKSTASTTDHTSQTPPQASAVLSPESDKPQVPASTRQPKSTIGASQKISIPAGTFESGSTPGDRGRDPTIEPALVKAELAQFTIDRLPYPNDPTAEPRTGVTRQQAAQLCEQREQRLCTELEWERACKGPDGDPYPTGSGWDSACEQHPNACATGFDVVAMGVNLTEWTSSNLDADEDNKRPAAVLRGANANAADTDHRCARRVRGDEASSGDSIGFRCCGGAPNAARIVRPVLQQIFRPAKVSASQATNIVRSVPQLEYLGDVSFFREPDDVDRVVNRGDTGKQGNILTANPVLWNPIVGEELLVISGLGSSGSSFIAAFFVLPNDRYRLASSFVLKNETGPVVLGYNGWTKNRLMWSTCWGCLGEEGPIIHREAGRVVIEQR
ncbi:MAG: hypothetical protein FWD57_13455 [Polyangiaceae bacterium]|nr:hypothetical protein [Polyangiaceae bacterium]